MLHIRATKSGKSAQNDIDYLRQMFGPCCEGLTITSCTLSASSRKCLAKRPDWASRSQSPKRHNRTGPRLARRRPIAPNVSDNPAETWARFIRGLRVGMGTTAFDQPGSPGRCRSLPLIASSTYACADIKPLLPGERFECRPLRQATGHLRCSLPAPRSAIRWGHVQPLERSHSTTRPSCASQVATSPLRNFKTLPSNAPPRSRWIGRRRGSPPRRMHKTSSPDSK